MLTREPETVSLSDHGIARDASTKLLRDRAGGLSGQPKARQHRHSPFVPMRVHAESRISPPQHALVGRSASRRRLFRSKPSLDLREERGVGN